MLTLLLAFSAAFASDHCLENGWYGDGICDEGCEEPDPDCGSSAPDSTDDYCAENGWYGDGVCDEDCAQPDPDCGDHAAPSNPYVADEPDASPFGFESDWLYGIVFDAGDGFETGIVLDAGDGFDAGDDFCASEGWYGDGICDDCPQPDPDCR